MPQFRRPVRMQQRVHPFLAAAITALLLLLPMPANSLGAEGAPTEGEPAATAARPRPVRVALYENKYKIFSDTSGTATGIFASILEEIARRENWRLEYVNCEWSECLAGVATGRLDLLPDISYSAERDRQFDFQMEPVVSSWSSIYGTGRKKIDAIADLKGLRVAVLKDSIQQRVLEQMASGFGLQVRFVEAASFEEAFALVRDGTADAAASNHFFGDYSYQQYGLKKTPVVFNPVALFFATGAGANHDLLTAIDLHLRQMKVEPGSEYYRVLRQWIDGPSKEIVPRFLWWLMAGMAFLLLLSLLFMALLRWQVRARTRQLADSRQQLAASEQKFRDLFHQHSAVKLLIDPENGSIVEANAAAEKFYGWPGSQLCRMRIHDINTLPAEQLAAIMAQAHTQGHAQFEASHRLADGSLRDVAVFCSSITVQQRLLLHSIIHDITASKQADRERKKLQGQLIQAQKMESIGRLAGGVAHDFNNILTVILGYAELAYELVHNDYPQNQYLQEILGAASRSQEITRQLLAFARQENITPEALDLNAAIEKMLKFLRRLIGEDIDLVWLPGKSSATVLIDPAQLDQILANLCVNARDAIAAVGTITIATETVLVDEAWCARQNGAVAGEYVRLLVRDDGCGMDAQTLENIFEPFFTTKEVGKGTGLGLATVYGIVQQNHGCIEVASEPGKGTAFSVYLPSFIGEIAAPADNVAESRPNGNDKTVLIVEDETAILSLAAEILGRHGYTVLAARTPSEALRLAGERPGCIDLLLTDVVLPEMNGHDLAERLRVSDPALQCLYMSGYTADIISRRGGGATARLFIQKPFTARDLAAKVQQALADGK